MGRNLTMLMRLARETGHAGSQGRHIINHENCYNAMLFSILLILALRRHAGISRQSVA